MQQVENMIPHLRDPGKIVGDSPQGATSKPASAADVTAGNRQPGSPEICIAPTSNVDLEDPAAGRPASRIHVCKRAADLSRTAVAEAEAPGSASPGGLKACEENWSALWLLANTYPVSTGATISASPLVHKAPEACERPSERLGHMTAAANAAVVDELGPLTCQPARHCQKGHARSSKCSNADAGQPAQASMSPAADNGGYATTGPALPKPTAPAIAPACPSGPSWAEQAAAHLGQVPIDADVTDLLAAGITNIAGTAAAHACPWGKVLTHAQMATLYNAARPRAPTRPAAAFAISRLVSDADAACLAAASCLRAGRAAAAAADIRRLAAYCNVAVSPAAVAADRHQAAAHAAVAVAPIAAASAASPQGPAAAAAASLPASPAAAAQPGPASAATATVPVPAAAAAAAAASATLLGPGTSAAADPPGTAAAAAAGAGFTAAADVRAVMPGWSRVSLAGASYVAGDG